MRRLLLVAVLLAALPVAAGAGGVMALPHQSASSPQSGSAAFHGATVVGTVTDADGDPVETAYVLVQPAFATRFETATNGSRPVGEALLDLAADPPPGIIVNATTAGGDYLVDLSGRGSYDVVAVTEDGRVSRIRTFEVGTGTVTVDLVVDPGHVLAVEGGDVAGTPGRTTTVTVSVTNTDDEAVRNLTVALGPLPDGWSVESVETAGSYHPSNRTVRWDRVAPGETATATVALSVPADAALETYAVGLRADAADHYVDHTDAVRVRVSPPDSTKTPESTPTPLDEDNLDVAVPTATPAAGGGGVPPLSVAVFATGVAVAAYAVGRTGMPFAGHDAD